MKVKFQTEELKKYLGKLAAVVSKKAAQPVYGFVRLFASQTPGALGFTVGMTGVDIDSSLTLTFTKAEAEGAVDVLLPFSKLVEIIANVNTAEVTVETDGETKAKLKDGRKFTGEMKPRPLAEWPAILDRPANATAVVGLAGFKDQISKIAFAVKGEADKFTVTVAKVESDGTNLRIVGTDGFGIAIADAPGQHGEWNLTVPKPALDLITKLEGSQLTISESEAGFYFDTETEILTFSRTHGTFPDYKAILPKAFATKITVEKDALQLAIKRIKALADGEKPIEVFAVQQGVAELAITGASLETITEGTTFRQNAEDSVDAVIEGNPGDFSLNVNMLLPFIDKATGPLVIQVINNVSIVDFLGNGGAYRWLQMPTQPATRV